MPYVNQSLKKICTVPKVTGKSEVLKYDLVIVKFRGCQWPLQKLREVSWSSFTLLCAMIWMQQLQLAIRTATCTAAELSCAMLRVAAKIELHNIAEPSDNKDNVLKGPINLLSL